MPAPNNCTCRNCGVAYNEYKSRADWKGYCSMRCQHAKAKSLGYRPNQGSTEYSVLSRAGLIGSVYIPIQQEGEAATT